jgi:hypothetical protein
LRKNIWTNPACACHPVFLGIKSQEPGVAMRFFALWIALGLLMPCTLAAQTSAPQEKKPTTGTTPSDQIQTETIKVPQTMQAPPRSMANQPGYMEPAQTHQLLAKLWQAEARVKDLASQVHPENLKMPAAELPGFNSNLDALRRSLVSLEESRQKFDMRVDSEYLGFETYAAISDVMPPLERLAVLLSRHNNPSLEGEFNQAWNDMLTLRQAFKPYLSFLLRNHDEIFATMETNLAGCQSELGYKNYKAGASPTYMRNVLPHFRGGRADKKAAKSEVAPKNKP